MEKSPSWSRAHDWKSCRPLKGLEGSNPSFSATRNPGTAMVSGFFSAVFPLFFPLRPPKRHKRIQRPGLLAWALSRYRKVTPGTRR